VLLLVRKFRRSISLSFSLYFISFYFVLHVRDGEGGGGTSSSSFGSFWLLAFRGTNEVTGYQWLLRFRSADLARPAQSNTEQFLFYRLY
jgi:hypothetical protein